MKKASEYRLHSKECRELATAMDSPEHRDQMLKMAEHWERLAEDRMALIQKHPDLAMPGEHNEERSWPPA